MHTSFGYANLLMGHGVKHIAEEASNAPKTLHTGTHTRTRSTIFATTREKAHIMCTQSSKVRVQVSPHMGSHAWLLMSCTTVRVCVWCDGDHAPQPLASAARPMSWGPSPVVAAAAAPQLLRLPVRLPQPGQLQRAVLPTAQLRVRRAQQQPVPRLWSVRALLAGLLGWLGWLLLAGLLWR